MAGNCTLNEINIPARQKQLSKVINDVMVRLSNCILYLKKTRLKNIGCLRIVIARKCAI